MKIITYFFFINPIIASFLRNNIIPIWSSTNKNILYNNNIVNIKGITWNGFETENMVFLGLYRHSLEFYLDTIRQQNFNAIRVPFSIEWIYYHNSTFPFSGSVYKDIECYNKTSLEILDLFFQKTLRKNILVVLSLDRLHKDFLTDLWFTSTEYPIDLVYQSWFILLDRYKNYPNLFAIDIFNEPHSDESLLLWQPFLLNFTNSILSRYPDYNWLFFIQGIDWSSKFLDIQVINSSRAIYTPHITEQINHDSKCNLSTLYSQFDSNFGFLQTIYNKNILVTQSLSFSDIWFKYFTQYLFDHDLHNIFLYQINADPHFGIFYPDWTNLRFDRLSLIQSIQNNITSFVFHHSF